MSTTRTFEGIIPAPPVVYSDASCRHVDLDAYADHLRFLMQYEISGLCIGGHAGETECLSMPERLEVIRTAADIAGGKVPIIAGVIADATWDAIDQTKRQIDGGADAVLVCPPNIVGWDAETADEMLLAHCRAIDRETRVPFLVYGGPGDRSACRQMPATMKKVAVTCESLVAWKIAVRGVSSGENSFADCARALTEAGEITGRTVSALIAGDADLVGVLENGGKGNVNACESIRVEDNTALLRAYRDDDLEKAREIQDRCRPIADIVYGVRLGRSFTYFHYRFKIATWMLGRIPNPMMRLPQVPPPAEEIGMIHDALLAAGKTPVHTAGDFAALSAEVLSAA